MKILLTANTTWNLAHFRAPLIRALSQDGHELVALSPDDDKVGILTGQNVRHVPLVMDNKGVGPLKDLALMRSLRRVFKTEKPDVILSFTIKNNIYGAIAAKSLGLNFLPNVSGLGTAFLGAGWLEKVAVTLYRFAFRRLPVVLFQNTDDSGVFLNRRIVHEDQVVILPGSGIDLERFRPAPLPAGQDDPITFLLIARMLRDKGVAEFAEAARIVKTTHPNARFRLLGATDVENRTAIDRTTIARWERDGLVEYLGSADDVRIHIEQADCVVLPSYREGTPRTLLEAAAMARPLVATDVPGCRNVVTHGTTGFLCQAKDPVDLADAMKRMIDIGPSERARLGGNGRSLMEARFDQEIVVGIYRQAIDRLLRPSGPVLQTPVPGKPG